MNYGWLDCRATTLLLLARERFLVLVVPGARPLASSVPSFLEMGRAAIRLTLPKRASAFKELAGKWQTLLGALNAFLSDVRPCSRLSAYSN